MHSMGLWSMQCLSEKDLMPLRSSRDHLVQGKQDIAILKSRRKLAMLFRAQRKFNVRPIYLLKESSQNEKKST